MNITTLIHNEERKYLDNIEKVVDYIVSHKKIRLLLIAGPSCSGKTTTSEIICSRLEKKAGIKAYTISIDDYYKDVILADGEKVSDKNFEGLDSIDVDLLHSHLQQLVSGKTVEIPLFNFKSMKRTGIREKVTLDNNSIAIIEGLHALNPVIFKGFVEEKYITSVFLNCINHELDSKQEKIPRLIRRLVRDSNFRNADASVTFSLWKNVSQGEEKYIFPFSHNAVFFINTFHSYEGRVLYPFVLKVMQKIKEDSLYFNYTKEIEEYLSGFSEIISTDKVPHSSLLREFIG